MLAALVALRLWRIIHECTWLKCNPEVRSEVIATCSQVDILCLQHCKALVSMPERRRAVQEAFMAADVAVQLTCDLAESLVQHVDRCVIMSLLLSLE